MKCERCGATISQGSSFCENCGFPVRKINNTEGPVGNINKEENRSEANYNPQVTTQQRVDPNRVDIQKPRVNPNSNNESQYQQSNHYNRGYNQYPPYNINNPMHSNNPSMPGYICVIAGGGLIALAGLFMLTIDNNYLQMTTFFRAFGAALIGFGAVFIGYALSKIKGGK